MNLLTTTLSQLVSMNKQVNSELLQDTARLFQLAEKNTVFPDEVEEHYQLYRNYQFVKGNHHLILFGVSVFCLFISSDIFLYIDMSLYPVVSRIVLALFIISSYLYFLKTAKISSIPNLTMFLTALGSLHALIGMVILPAPENQLFMIGVIMFVVFGMCLFRFCFQQFACLITINITMYVLYLLVFSDILINFSLTTSFHRFDFLIFILLQVVALIGMYTAWLVERLHRKEWLQNQIAKNEINKQNQLVKKLHEQSFTDGLTQIPNRRFFDKQFKHYWNYHSNNQLPLSIVMVDVDWFKPYNDNYGHQRGDDCLQQISYLLKRTVDTKDQQTQSNQNLDNTKDFFKSESYLSNRTPFIARYGGEEFIVLLPNTNKSQAINFAHILCEDIHEARIPHEYSPLKVCSVSVGVSTDEMPSHDDKEHNMTQLIRQADDALYLSKSKGKNCVSSIQP